MKRATLVGGASVAALVLSMTGLAGTASADPADDAATMVDNLPATVDELLAGVETAVDVLATTQSAVEASEALGATVVEAGSTLVAGTEQFGALGLGLRLVDGGIQPVLGQYLGAIDDPSTAAGVIDPNDAATLLANLPGGVDGLLHGDSFGGGLLAAVAEALRGNLVFGPGTSAIGMPAFIGNVFNGFGFGLTSLLAGTSFEAFVLPVAAVLLVGAIGGSEYLAQLEEASAAGFDALEPATGPVADQVEDL